MVEIQNMEVYKHQEWTVLCFIFIIVQKDATQNSLIIILQVHFKYFGCQRYPSSRVHKTVTTASGIGHNFYAAASLQRDCDGDGCGWHPKHVEWAFRIINRLVCVASRWTIINIDQRCMET